MQTSCYYCANKYVDMCVLISMQPRNPPVSMKTSKIILAVIAIAIIASKAYNSPNRITDTDTVTYLRTYMPYLCTLQITHTHTHNNQFEVWNWNQLNEFKLIFKRVIQCVVIVVNAHLLLVCSGMKCSLAVIRCGEVVWGRGGSSKVSLAKLSSRCNWAALSAM